MFSDSRDPGLGERGGFSKPHTSHFLPWFRNGLKPQRPSDLGLSRPYKCTAGGEPRGNLAPLERTKGMGFFSRELIQGKDKGKKGELRCNGVRLARRLMPEMLRAHSILPEKVGKREGSPAKWSQSPELDRDPDVVASPGEQPQGPDHSSTSVQDHYSERSTVSNHRSHFNLLRSQTDRAGPSPGKHVPLTPVHFPASPGEFKGQEGANFKTPVVVVCTEEGREKPWHCDSYTSHHKPDSQLSGWLATQGIIDRRRQGLGSGVSHSKELSGADFQSQRDLSKQNGDIFSTGAPSWAGVYRNRTLRGPRRPRPSSEHVVAQCQSQTSCVRTRPSSGGELQTSAKDAGLTGPRRKAVQNQIKRVVDNLEQVLGALKDVHQEMREVVEQIDYLTSAIDLDEAELAGETRGGGDCTEPPADSSSSSSSSSSGVTVSSNHQRPSDQEENPGSTDLSAAISRGQPFDHTGSVSPTCMLQHIQGTAVLSTEITKTPNFPRKLGCSLKRCAPPSYPHDPPALIRTGSLPQPQSLASSSHAGSPLAVRPPTPGLSPLTVNSHHPNSVPTSPCLPQPQSPGPSPHIRVCPSSPLSPMPPQPPPPPALSPSVIIETKVVSDLTVHGDHPPASPLSPLSSGPPSPSSPPRDFDSRHTIRGEKTCTDSLAPRDHTPPAGTTKIPLAQSRGGRKPPPYPHNGHFERVKKAKEPRRAPPYPEKRRLLSTTV